MKVLILGASGALGHKFYQLLSKELDTWVTFRSDASRYAELGFYDEKKIVSPVDAYNFNSVEHAVMTIKPDVVVNVIGIVKQLKEANDPVSTITINALFPHRLAGLCQQSAIRLIHISTDCVFSGSRGMYQDADFSDAEDLYGRTKALGELPRPSLTLRTSTIGRELAGSSGLLEWFLNQKGKKIKGYTRAVFSGLSTIELSRVLADVIKNYPNLSGLYNVSSESINKNDLLCLLRDRYHVNVEIEPCEAPKVDRSLNSERFKAATNFAPPSWADMIREMADDRTPYEQWRHCYVA